LEAKAILRKHLSIHLGMRCRADKLRRLPVVEAVAELPEVVGAPPVAEEE